ncbi:MAG: helix-turn-helix domain-containing protein [Phaeodactylibacter sp.]|nr:helix-turn-helix domain-containing protein [Phaeodactylibacter sp.]
MNGTLHIPDLIVAGLIALGIFLGLTVGLLFLLRKRGNKKSNLCFGILSLVFAIALANTLLLHLGLFHLYPALQYIPLWYTLAFGPCLFYAVKFQLYPSYEMRWSDSKHFILPLLQGLFYWIVWFQAIETKMWVTEAIVFPFYKTLEGVLFVLSFFSYLALSYRYAKYKEATLKKRGFDWERQKVRWLKRVLRVLFLLAGLNTFYIVADFVAYQFLNLDLFGIKAYAYMTDLSFAAMLYWLAWAGLNYEMRGWYRVRKSAGIKQLAELLDQKMEEEKIFRDPELNLEHLAKTLQVEVPELEAHIQEQHQSSFDRFLDSYRIREIQARMQNPHYRNYSTASLGYAAGFTSKQHFQKSFEKTLGQRPQAFRDQLRAEAY